MLNIDESLNELVFGEEVTIFQESQQDFGIVKIAREIFIQI